MLLKLLCVMCGNKCGRMIVSSLGKFSFGKINNLCADIFYIYVGIIYVIFCVLYGYVYGGGNDNK